MTGVKRLLMGILAAIAVPFSAAAQDSVPARLMTPASLGADADDIAANFETALDAAFATGDFVGLSVAVVRRGETELLKSWGVLEAGSDSRVTPATVFRIASLSKGIAGSLAGMAMTEGLLSPDDLAAPYAPGLALAGGAEKSLTLSHLLSHRTGLPPNAYDNLLEENVPVGEILPKYRGVALSCPVGKCYAYQNIAFDLIGGALSSVYEQPYEALARQKLFWPLGMMTASFGEGGLTQTANWARPHTRERLVKGAEAFGPWRPITVKPAYYRIPAAGGVNASLFDMTAWLKAQMGKSPKILPAQALALIHAPRVTTPAEIARMRPVSPRFSAAQYGFGWRLYQYGGAPVIAHSGTVDGYAAQIAWLPDHDVGIVILSNARSKRLWRILPTFLDLELGLSREDWLALKETGAVAGSK
ncbi:MAG: serine hydrolase domain-containing protein [Parvularculaceae bacterium]